MSGWLIGAAVACNAVLAIASYAKGAVSRSGAIAGFLVGFGVFVFGGADHFVILGTFFLSSSMLSRLGKQRKAALDRVHEKGDRRDVAQVLANGGVGLVASALVFATGSGVWAVAYGASFAASNADTWSSEVGVLSRARPRSILTWRPVDRGVSGGVTALGLAAGAAGAISVGAVAIVSFGFAGLGLPFLPAAVSIVFGGFFGTLVDSLLGATLQAQYREQLTGAYTERRRGEGGNNVLTRGMRFVNNDAVNLVACATGTAVAVLLFRLLA